MDRLTTLAISALTVVALTGCDSNAVPVEGHVISISHKCRYEIKRGDPLANRMRDGQRPSDNELYGDCSSDPDFAKAKQDFDGFKTRFSGHSKVRVAYISPVDNTSLEGTLDFDGDDREFYTLHVNQAIPLMVDKTDHNQIRFGG